LETLVKEKRGNEVTQKIKSNPNFRAQSLKSKYKRDEISVDIMKGKLLTQISKRSHVAFSSEPISISRRSSLKRKTKKEELRHITFGENEYRLF